MAKQKPVLAIDLKNWIESKVKSNFDYSLATNRRSDIENFIEANNKKYENKLKLESVRASHFPILNKVLKAQGIDPESLGRRKNRKTGLKYQGDMNSKITPSPQAGETDTTKPKIATGQVNAQGQLIQQPIQEIFSKESVSASFAGLFLTLKVAFPDLEDLTDQEKKSLGELWHSAFNLYISNEKMAVIGIPLISTLGMFIPKILASRKKTKIRKSKEEGLEIQKEVDTKNTVQQEKIDVAKQENKPVLPELDKPTMQQILEKNKTLPKDEIKNE